MSYMSWADACAEVGYDQKAQCPFKDEIVWFGYKEGVAQKFTTQTEAENYTGGKRYLVERVIVKNADKNAWFENARALEMKASEIWHQALREEYSYLTDEVYALCYARAYDAGHSAGYDEVRNEMIDAVEFAEAVWKACK